MRLVLAAVVGIAMTGVWSHAGWTQRILTYPAQPEVDGLVDILFDDGSEEGIDAYPEQVVIRQSFEANSFLADLFNRKYPPSAFTTQDLPSPYTASVGSQAGYYRVTLTTPPFSFVKP
jgi:hypothetical protein